MTTNTEQHKERIQIHLQQSTGWLSSQKKLSKKRKVLDSVHGFIYFSERIWKFIDTSHFQRLRNIKQLGCLYYVFPGATHTRFEHCLGTGHLAKKYIEALIKNQPDLYLDKNITQSAKFTVTLAGIMHDLGHGPYSHTFDSQIVREIQIDVNGEKETRQWSHQLASQVLFDDLIRQNKLEEEGIITKEEQRRVKALISGHCREDEKRKWEFLLISNKINGIDVDKLDYFRRDAFYLGAKNIYIDHDLLINESRIINNEICFPTKYAQMVYNIFHCRYKLYKNYYHNIVSKGIQFMVCDIMKLVSDKFRFKQICDQIYSDPKRYMRLSDSIMEKIQDIYEDMLEKNETGVVLEKFRDAVKLLHRIQRRDIYRFVKEIHYFIKEGKEKSKQEAAHIISHLSKDKIKASICDESGIDPSQIYISASDIGFGLKEANPLTLVGFFQKELPEPYQKIHGTSKLSMLFTNQYIERSIKIYLKDASAEKYKKIDKALRKFSFLFNDQFKQRLQKVGFDVVIEGELGKTPQQGEKKPVNKLSTKSGLGELPEHLKDLQ